MRQKKTALILFVLLAGLFLTAGLLYSRLSGQAAQEEASSRPELPDPIPAVDFQLENSAGEPQSFLELLDGRPAILNFWAANCPPCRQEMPHFQQAYETYGDDIQFLMVNVLDAMGDTRESAQAYLEEESYTFPVYYDSELSGVMSYGLQGFPTTFFLNGEGELILGFSGMMSEAVLQTYLYYAFPDLVEEPASGL